MFITMANIVIPILIPVNIECIYLSELGLDQNKKFYSGIRIA